MFDLWSKSMSSSTFDDWKADIKKKAKEKETGGITGVDIAQL